jgi:O-antigen ligase
VVGLVVLLAAAPSREQVRAAATALGAAVLAAAGGAFFPGVAALDGSAGERQTEGAIVLGILAAIMVAAALLQARECRPGAPSGRLAMARRLPAIAGAVAAIGLAGLVVAGLGEEGRGDELSGRHGVSRLTTADSRRYDYWRVGLDAIGEQPLRGLGAGGFRVEWMRERPVREAALEVHSLPLEMSIELGLPGLLGFCLLVGGVAVAGGHALRRHPELAPGACAATTVWLLHATIDWDWQIPAVTIPAVVMAGALVAASETPAFSRAGSAA